jgi:CubicO group peptidase (beta-lactamase class C family)
VNDGRFDIVREQMAAHVDDGVGGLVWAVSIGDEMASGAAGWLDPDRRERPMGTDAIFRIASVSKPIGAVAALQLVDAGLTSLDAPIDDVLPELADRRVLVDPDGPVDGATVPADRPITLRDLLSFRCGLGMDFDFDRPQPLLERLWELGVGPGPTAPECEPNEFMSRLSDLPLADQPGTRWRYHTGSDIASVFVERVRGEPLDVVLARDVFDPLCMTDTAFWVTADRLDRFGSCRMGEDDDGALLVWDRPDGRWSTSPAFRSGAAGLVSTVADLVGFGRMLLRGGAGPHRSVLGAALAEEMSTDQLTTAQRHRVHIADTGHALGWGLGLAVRHEAAPGGWPPPGSYGWDGGLGSRWLVDPSRDLCAVLLSTDAFSSPTGAPPVVTAFVDAVAAAVRQ